jgi:hypothetical protein
MEIVIKAETYEEAMRAKSIMERELPGVMITVMIIGLLGLMLDKSKRPVYNAETLRILEDYNTEKSPLINHGTIEETKRKFGLTP